MKTDSLSSDLLKNCKCTVRVKNQLGSSEQSLMLLRTISALAGVVAEVVIDLSETERFSIAGAEALYDAIDSLRASGTDVSLSGASAFHSFLELAAN